jgi:amino acid transporter
MNTALLAMTASSRLLYGIADRGPLPKVLTKVTAKTHVPYIASGLALATALLFVLPGDLGLAAEATNLAIYLVFLFVNLSVIRLRFKKPQATAGFRVPVSLFGVPVTAVLAIFSVCVMMAFLPLQTWLVGAGYVAFGGILWWLRPASARHSDSSRPHLP